MNYDDIRPCTDAELPAAMQRIAQQSVLPQIIKFVYPDSDIQQEIARLRAIESIHDFQSTFMNDAIKRIIASTTDDFTYSGLNRLRRGGNYLFVSNHRDITLDAFLLQHLLLELKGDTSYIVFGDNLLAMPAAADLFRCNKLISMSRGGSPRAFYNSLHHLSEYIHQLVVEERHSVWIAQKNGRAKDGLDTTAPAIVKMLSLGSTKPPQEALADLHIVPMSISYEWDPCDTMKANELHLSSKGHYTKAPDEDFTSVVTGIVGHKGRVHLNIGAPLTPAELQPADGEDIFEHVASVLDSRIQHGYKLMPSNFAAYDLFNGVTRFRRRYSPAIVRQLQERQSQLPDDDSRRLLLQAYANPVMQTL